MSTQYYDIALCKLPFDWSNYCFGASIWPQRPKKGETTFLSLICSAFFLYAVATSVIFFGKTIELHEDGCTIRFLFFKRYFPWSHYETKLYQKASGKKTTAISIHATILFLPCFLWKTKSPLFFCQFFYPFSGICLAVQPEKATKIFEINEKDIPVLQQLGVQIRGLAEAEKKE